MISISFKVSTLSKFAFTGLLLLSALSVTAKKTHKHGAAIYGSWGYNTEWYTHPNIRISQPSLGNDYTLNHVTAHDHRGWDHHLLNQPITIPQFNCRLGYMFNEDKGWAVELTYDHPKFIVSDGQQVHVTGKRNGQPVDETITFSEPNGFYYYLNNGANFFLFNMVKRWKLISDKKDLVRLDAVGKLGMGFMVPHVENELYGDKNNPHFEINGWNTAFEATLRLTFLHYAYIEYCNKFDYARYRGLKIYQGTARQNMGTYEMILNLGFYIPTHKKTRILEIPMPAQPSIY
jgi:hypothetical protein